MQREFHKRNNDEMHMLRSRKTPSSLRSGFTLIELLVVIAIIGIMAAVVLASLGDSRDDAVNARIQTMTNDLRTMMEVYYNRNGTYSGIFTDADIDDQRDRIQELNPQLPGSDEHGEVTDEGHKWIYSTPLVGDDRGHWCIDSNGFAGEIENRPTSGSETCQ